MILPPCLLESQTVCYRSCLLRRNVLALTDAITLKALGPRSPFTPTGISTSYHFADQQYMRCIKDIYRCEMSSLSAKVSSTRHGLRADDQSSDRYRDVESRHTREVKPDPGVVAPGVSRHTIRPPDNGPVSMDQMHQLCQGTFFICWLSIFSLSRLGSL